MEREKLRQAVRTYAGKEETFRFQLSEELKSKQIANAIKGYAKGIRPEDVVALLDTTVLESGKAGFLLTENKLYGSYGKDSCAVDGVFSYKKKDTDVLLLQYKNGSEQELYIGTYTEVESFIRMLPGLSRTFERKEKEAGLVAALKNVQRERMECSQEKKQREEKYSAEVLQAREEKRAAEEAARTAEEKWRAAEARALKAKQRAEEARRKAEAALRRAEEAAIAEEKRRAEEAAIAEEKRRAEEAAIEAEKNRRVEELLRMGEEQYQEEKAAFEEEEKRRAEENECVKAEIEHEEEPWRSIKAKMMEQSRLGYVDVQNIVPGMVIQNEEEKFLVIAVERDEGEEEYQYDTLYLVDITYEGTLMSAGKCDPVASNGCQALPLDHGESVEVLNYTKFDLIRFGTYGRQIAEFPEQIERFTMEYTDYEAEAFCFEEWEYLYNLIFVSEQTVVDSVKGVEKGENVDVFFYGATPFWIEKR